MFFKNWFKLYYWPVLTFIWFILSFIITYIISVLNGHVYVYFPNISDTGATPPESCIFSQLINIGAVIFAITMYIRYRQINIFLKFQEGGLGKKWNVLGFWSGVCVTVGISIVANFQETEVLVVHGIGAFMTFGIGTLYLGVQTIISFSLRHIYYKYKEYGIGPKMLYFRAFLTTTCIVLCNIACICLFVALRQFKGEKISWWTEKEGAFEFRLVASFSEWIVAICFATFMLSLTKEYKLMEYEEIHFISKCGMTGDLETKL